MKRTAQIFIEGVRLDLFEDESISLNSSIQTIKDISKVYNDFSQSFSVPASDNNNQIFQHFYNSEVILRNGGFVDHQIKRSASIEIDGTPFRRGKIALEKATLKDAMPSSYQLTFYGELTALKDLFGETMLSELDWSAYNHEYNYAEVKDRIINGSIDYDVRYPLISSQRYWQYDNPALPNENIDTSAGAISWLELFPALKLRRVLETIESEFGIEFTGGWKTDARFNKHFGLFKNTNTFSYSTPAIDVDFLGTYDGVGNPVPPEDTNVNITDNSIDIDYFTWSLFGQTIDYGTHVVRATISNVSNPVATYYFDVYESGNLVSSASGSGNGNIDILSINNSNNTSLDGTYTFKFRSDSPLTADLNFQYLVEVVDPILGTIPFNWVFISCSSVATSTLQNMAVNAPEVSVAQYFGDILRAFNLTCYGVGNDQYRLETIEQWYLTGRIIDITEHTETTNIEVERIKLYKKIAFKYKECKSLVNRFFASTFSREYGDLEAVYDYEGGEFKIEVGFENLLFSKFDNTPLQVGYCLDENTNPYNPNPIILSIYPEQAVNFYLTNDITPEQVSSYVPFGQDSLVGSTNYSLNWGAEISSLLEATIGNGLYQSYYAGYISNLYNFRNRLVKVKCKLPLSILTTLALNDRLVIRDKRYIIDTFTTDLTTGVTNFELLLDFRDMLASTDPTAPIKPVLPIIAVPNVADPPVYTGCIDYYVPFINGATEVNIYECTSPLIGVTINPMVLTEAGNIEICIPDNSNPVTPLVSEQNDPYKPDKEVLFSSENGYYVQHEKGFDTLIKICIEYTTPQGNIVQPLYITQQGNILKP